MTQLWSGWSCSFNPSISASLPWGISVGGWPSCGNRNRARHGTSYGASSFYEQFNSGSHRVRGLHRVPAVDPLLRGVRDRDHVPAQHLGLVQLQCPPGVPAGGLSGQPAGIIRRARVKDTAPRLLQGQHAPSSVAQGRRGVSAAPGPYSVSCEGQTRLPQETGFERIPKGDPPTFTVRALTEDSGLGNHTARLHSAIADNADRLRSRLRRSSQPKERSMRKCLR